ncbi:metallophosphoesterase [Maribellus comscasis]|uniref:Metallophosphoesterase n=2 Tax=Maribellus comscasis TaxID=2681766 RepID=A0A6I6JVV8_9BACT|nr:metallophosphoesterase [Maribellus comscasis]
MSMRRLMNLSFGLAFLIYVLSACETKEQEKHLSVEGVIDKAITVLYQTRNEEELAALTNEQAFALFSEEEKQTLSSKHWMFDVSVPVVVSVIRSIKQKDIPFWLENGGFTKTGMTLKNEMTTYEVWQKEFDSGRVGLGINGFGNYGLHYFVSVGPQNRDDKLVLSNFFPENQYVGTMDNGAFTYHDWDELVLEDVPAALQGQKLLTTIRGRGVETHLVGAFRKTIYPSSAIPDQVMLTWSSNPATGIDIQWRTDTTVNNGSVVYWEEGSSEMFSVNAERYTMEDLRLMNDRFCNRFTAQLRGLKPGKRYEYQISPENEWNEKYKFTTEEENDSFSFIWFGDTHYSPEWGKVANVAFRNHPDAAFYTIAGDLVSDGLHRDQWDELFAYSEDIISQRPFMNVPGNHDNRLGLGAKMYRDMFSYPGNGPDDVNQEQTYAFTYKNSLFLMIDATSPVEKQTTWIENQLKNSDAIWKFAVFHFPPYNWEEPYLDIQKEWVPVFDKYHVDMVFGGHIHYYMRSKPLKNGDVVASYNDGTAYIISIGIPSKTEDFINEPYAELRKMEGQFYQYIEIDDNQLIYKSVDSDNNVIDSFNLKK